MAPTVVGLSIRYMEEHSRAKKKASSSAHDQILWNSHILPRLGKTKVAGIRRADVEALRAALREKPATANRSLALLSKAFNLAEIWGWRPSGTNPCRGVERYPERKRKRYLTPDEARRMGRALGEFEEMGGVGRRFAALVRVLYMSISVEH